MERVKVSVVMAVYNGELYLKEQLDSLRDQSYQPDEVIICDDVSIDSSQELICHYIEDNRLYDSWKLYRNEKNLGYAENFYQGMQKAKGQYIFLCDQDDIWLPDKIEKMVGIMDINPEIQLLASEYEPYYFTTDAPRISSSVLKSMTNDGSLEFVDLSYKNIFIRSEGCTMCLRKGMLEYIEKYWFVGWAHDECFWKMAQCLEGCYVYHYTTLRRRLHSNNVSKKKRHGQAERVNSLQNLLGSHKKMLEFAIESNVSSKKLEIIQNNIKSVQMRIELIQNRKLRYFPILAFGFFRCYESKKSLLVEFLIALKSC